MKGILLVSAFVLSVFVARSLVSPKKTAIPKFNYLSCHGEVEELNVNYRGEFFLVKRALPTPHSDAWLWASAWRNNVYAFENHTYYSPSLAKSVATGYTDVKILGTEDAAYPQDVKISSEVTKYVYPHDDTDYIKKLFQLSSVKKGEPALKVTYEVNQTLYTCHGQGAKFRPEDLKFYIPNDPYLAVDFYPESEKRLLYFPLEKSFAKATPCYVTDMMRSKKKLNALSFGYGWKPFVEGHGADKKSFSCPSYYRVGENITLISPVITRKDPAKVSSLDFSRFDDLNRPIKASVFFGAADNYDFSKFDPEDAKSYVEKFLSDISVSEARKNLPFLQGKYDRTFSRLLIFLKNMRGHITTHSYDVMATPEVVQIKFQGKFKLSKKDIEVFILFSPNLPENSSYELFEYSFASKFLSSDIIIYDGHNAGGRSLEKGLELAQRTLEKSSGPPPPAYQIFGVLACSANGVYNIERIPKVKGMERDIVYGLSGYSDSAANGALSFIVAADQYLYNQRVPHFGNWATYFKTDNHYLLVNQR
jgi:hypothetical protein